MYMYVCAGPAPGSGVTNAKFDISGQFLAVSSSNSVEIISVKEWSPLVVSVLKVCLFCV